MNTAENKESSQITESSSEAESSEKKSFTYRWEHSPYLAARVSYKILNSIWVGVMAVSMFLAWLIALLAT